jgi:hypothetical protein
MAQKADVTIEEVGDELVDLPDLPDPDADDGTEPTGPTEATNDTPEQVSPALMEEMNVAYNYWHTHGYPEKASVIWECIEQKRRPPANLLPGNETGIHPETAVDPTSLVVPERAGPEATHIAWRAFAKRTLDMEPDIIDQLDRKDLIRLLEDKGVIEKVQSPAK